MTGMPHKRHTASCAVGLTVATIFAAAIGGCSGLPQPPGQTELSGIVRMFPPLEALTEPIHLEWCPPVSQP